MKRTFLDDIQQKEFAEKGFILLPLLQSEQINALLDLANRYSGQFREAFHSSHFSSDSNYKREAHTLISEIVFPRISSLLTPHEPIFGNFMVKKPDAEVYMQLHADWAYVDENEARSISVWLPLVDTDENNGCLGIIEGSHKVLNAMRGPGIKQSSYQHDKDWVKKYGKLIPMKAGHAIIYDHGLLHYSLANKSNKIRPALNLSIVPQTSQLIHYYSESDEAPIEQYGVPNKDFYINYQSFSRPVSGNKIQEISREGFETIDNRMAEKYGYGKTIWQKLGGWLKT